MRNAWLVAVFIAVLLTEVACVQWRDRNWIRCEDKDPDVRIAGCTAVIQAVQNTPSRAAAFYYRGTAYAEKGDADRAIHDYDEALQLKLDAATFYARGQMYAQKKGDVDRAIQDFNQAISFNPQLYQALLQRGMEYLTKGDKDHAIHDFDEAIRLNPVYVLAYHNRGIAHWLKGDTDHAMQDFNRTIKLQPQFSQPFYQRGRLYADEGDHDRAIQDFVYALTFRGVSHFRAGHYDLAIGDWDAVLKLDPDRADFPKRAHLLFCRGLAKRQTGDTAGGDADIATAKNLDANIADDLAKLGIKL